MSQILSHNVSIERLVIWIFHYMYTMKWYISNCCFLPLVIIPKFYPRISSSLQYPISLDEFEGNFTHKLLFNGKNMEKNVVFPVNTFPWNLWTVRQLTRPGCWGPWFSGAGARRSSWKRRWQSTPVPWHAKGLGGVVKDLDLSIYIDFRLEDLEKI